VVEFETQRPELAGVMTMTTTLTEVPGGTDVEIVHEGLPDAVSPEDNEAGTRMALDKLAGFLETA
jgi:hypothetical protein